MCNHKVLGIGAVLGQNPGKTLLFSKQNRWQMDVSPEIYETYEHLSYVQNCSNARPLSLHLFEAVGVRCDSCWLCSASVTSGAVSLRGTLPNGASCARRPNNQIGAGLGGCFWAARALIATRLAA